MPDQALIELAASMDFVPNFANRIDRTVWRGREHEHAYYDTPFNGVHLCGEGAFNAAATAWRVECSETSARWLFAHFKEIAKCEEAEADFVADLFVNGDVVEDFYTNRQLWSAALRALASDKTEEG